MTKFNLIVYKSNSSYSCSRGCCYGERFDSEFEIIRDLTPDEARDAAVRRWAPELHQGEAAYELTLIPIVGNEDTEAEAALILSEAEHGIEAKREELRIEQEARNAKAFEAREKRDKEAQEKRDWAEFERLAQKLGQGAHT